MIGDSLGQHTMGGFVKSFSCEFNCRFCPISKQDFSDNPDKLLPPRTPEEYNEHVRLAKLKWEQIRRKAIREARNSEKRALKNAKKTASRVALRCSAPGTRTLVRKLISKNAMKKLRAVNYKGVKS